MSENWLARLTPAPVLSAAAVARRSAGARLRERRALRRLVREAEAVTEHCLDRVPGGPAPAASAALREELRWMLGIPAEASRAAVSAVATIVEGHVPYRLERVVFESRPGLVVTANLYLPVGPGAPWPCVVYLCGHWPSVDGAKTGYQDRYLWYPRNGFALFVIDPLGYGEVTGLHRGTHDLSMWSWFSRGYTPAGVEAWNGIRAIDYLKSRPEIDSGRLGVTGISGGGASAWYLAAVDERVSVAAPSCSTYSIGNQARRRLVREQCDCVFPPNVHQFDLPTVASLIAPRPLLMLGGTQDPIFPPDGFRTTYRLAREAYRRIGGEPALEKVRLVEARCGHEDPPLFLQSTREWMDRWLAPSERVNRPAGEEATEALRPPRELRCLDAPPVDALNYSVHESFVAVAEPGLPADTAGWEARRARVVDDLRRTVFRWIPEPASVPRGEPARESAYYARTYGAFEAWSVETEDTVAVRVLGLRRRDARPEGPRLLVVRSREEGWQFPDLEPLLPILGLADIFILYPRFVEKVLSPARYAEIERTAALSGRTVAALQSWDTCQVARWLARDDGGVRRRTLVAGRGDAAVVALYAALLTGEVAGVVMAEPPPSHRQGPPLLTVLRTTDLWEAASLLAPRPLGFVGEPPPDYRLTVDALGRAGHGRRVASRRSVFEAVAWALREIQEEAPGPARGGVTSGGPYEEPLEAR